MRLILLRHGLTMFNAEGRMQGHTDTPLTERGQAQARAAAQQLGRLPIAAIYSSDLARARDTALAVAAIAGCDVTCDERLRETYLGTWQGQTRADIDAAFPGARGRWREDPHWAPEGGETQRQVARRARDFVDELIAGGAHSDDATILLVAHGGLSSALATSLLNFADNQISSLSRLGNCCWGEFSSMSAVPGDPARYRWCLDSWNRSADVGRAPPPGR